MYIIFSLVVKFFAYGDILATTIVYVFADANESLENTSLGKTVWGDFPVGRVKDNNMKIDEIMRNILDERFESLRGGFPSRWESVGFCPIDASIRRWQRLPSGYVL
ncbi:hypothetical protein Tco_1164317 [Tanacetum coccineum]